jgi:hypothetical protein
MEKDYTAERLDRIVSLAGKFDPELAKELSEYRAEGDIRGALRRVNNYATEVIGKRAPSKGLSHLTRYVARINLAPENGHGRRARRLSEGRTPGRSAPNAITGGRS